MDFEVDPRVFFMAADSISRSSKSESPTGRFEARAVGEIDKGRSLAAGAKAS